MTKVLGPGLRYVLWVQGCKKNCPGCINPEGQPLDKNGYWTSVNDIFEEILQGKNLTGITISGGEPFLQPEPLAKLILLLKEQTNLDVMIYSGYTLRELHNMNNEFIECILENSDILVDGTYIEELNTNKIYRGSDNQVIHFLSSKYIRYKDIIEKTNNRSVEFVLHGEDLFMVGIPAKDFSTTFWEKVVEESKRR